MIKRDIIVIGASAGGIEALTKLFKGMPDEIEASVFIVLHMREESGNLLPSILSGVTGIPVSEAGDGEIIEKNKIYTARPDYHLIIEEGKLRVTKGPKENRFRPSVDPLFRSAALTYGQRVIGIILSGMLNDGTSGLWSIKDKKGITIVQNPSEALYGSMPMSAIQNNDVDYISDSGEIAALLINIMNEKIKKEKLSTNGNLRIEVEMTASPSADDSNMNLMGDISSFTCPECNGTLWKMREGNILRFRCRTGHAFTAETLLENIEESIENNLWSVSRGMEESASLMNNISEHLADKNNHLLAGNFRDRASDTKRKAILIRELIMGKTEE